MVKVKGNQKCLLRAIQEIAYKNRFRQQFIENKTNKGRKERREIRVFGIDGYVPEGWQGLARIIEVKRLFISKNKRHQTLSYYITNLATDDAWYLADIIRGHWFIENKFHYVKDVVMLEDKASTKNNLAAPILALFRNITFNLLKMTDKSIKYATEIFASYNIKQILNILFRT